ncbi:MAG: O-antigen ligase family protein [Betaproteobacteria bacterium]
MTRRFEPALLPFMLLLAILPFPGTVALRLICLAAAFAYAVYAWKRLVVPPFPFKVVLVVWVLIVLASLFYAVDPTYSLGEIKNELGYTMMAFVAFFAICSDEKRMKWMLFALTVSALLLCSMALLAQAPTGGWDHNGWHGGVATYAMYIAALVPAMVLLVFFYEDVNLRFLAILALVFLFAAGLYSAQRIIWPVLFLQVCVAIFFYRKRFGLDAARIAAVLCILALVAAIVLFSIQKARVDNYQWNATASVQMNNDDRMVFWPKVMARIMEHPLSGAGFGRGVMNKAYRDIMPSSNNDLWHAHNLVLNYGISMGIPGMLVILLLFGALVRQYLQFCRSADRKLKLLGVCGIALVSGIFARNMVNDLFLRDGALLFWALNGSFLGLGLRMKAAETAHKANAHA